MEQFWLKGGCEKCGQVKMLNDDLKCKGCVNKQKWFISQIAGQRKECNNCGKEIQKSYAKSGMCQNCYEEADARKRMFYNKMKYL